MSREKMDNEVVSVDGGLAGLSTARKWKQVNQN